MHNGFVERLGRAEAFGVPRGDFAEHHAAAIFAEDLDHQFIMPAQDADAFVEGGLGEEFTGFYIVPGVLENPRIIKRAAANGHTGATGGFKHVRGGLGGGDIAVAYHGQVGHGLHYAANTVKLHGAFESLSAIASACFLSEKK